MKLTARHLLLVLPLVVAVASCDSVFGSDDGNLTVSFAVPGSGANANLMASVVADPITLNGHTLDLQSADVVFARLTLDRIDSNDERDSEGDSEGDSERDSERDSDSEGDSDEEEELRFGWTTVSLPLDGGVVTPITASVPAGTYESIEFRIETVRLRGTFDGEPFDVTVLVNKNIEHEFSPPFVVDSDDDKPNITITIDPSLWFRTNGSLIDPRSIATNKDLRNLLIQRLRVSFRAFEDSDHDADDRDSDSDSH